MQQTIANRQHPVCLTGEVRIVGRHNHRTILVPCFDASASSDADGLIAKYDYVGPQRVKQRDYGNGTRMTYLNDAGTMDIGYDGLRRTEQLRSQPW